MRFIGNKEKIVHTILGILNKYNIQGESFFDFFSGTANVAKLFKKLNYKVFSSDVLFFSHCLQQAYILNNIPPTFTDFLSTRQESLLYSGPLTQMILYLNQVSPIKGFIYDNYTEGGTSHLPLPRKYFSDANGQKIDAVRQQIEALKPYISKSEYYILLACLIESVSFYANIAGTYATFHKKWDPRATKPFILRPINLVYNNKDNATYLTDSINLCQDIDVDILYLDPPYNERQYAPNYHLLETIACYDMPEIHGISGMRPYGRQKSQFCNVHTALSALEYIAKTARYKYFVLSYNSEGIMPYNSIMNVLGKYGEVAFEQFPYTRYKSNNNGTVKTRKYVYEQLFMLKKS